MVDVAKITAHGPHAHTGKGCACQGALRLDAASPAVTHCAPPTPAQYRIGNAWYDATPSGVRQARADIAKRHSATFTAKHDREIAATAKPGTEHALADALKLAARLDAELAGTKPATAPTKPLSEDDLKRRMANELWNRQEMQRSTPKGDSR